ncbi:MAG: hypothetical protein QG568_203 [Patescibacteria group bacterium]|nr:hypothetical protein [Patescibacteria group bacterium]
MTSPDPWCATSDDNTLVSPDGLCRVRYEKLSEFRMSSPLGGDCYIDTYLSKLDLDKETQGAPDTTFKIPSFVGYPACWQVDGRKIAIPLWNIIQNNDPEESQTIFQRLGIVDMNENTLTIYKQEFRVLHIKAFIGTKVEGVDSPIHDSKDFVFDIENEDVVSVVPLDKIN